MKLCADWLDEPGSVAVFKTLHDGGYKAWFVGGCVRNGLLGHPVDDIDICTDAHPPAVMTLAEQAGLKAVPTGIDHGTITIVADGLAHEVTTLRKDVSTDGRRATVAFSNSLQEDAARRDFTINALYATSEGDVLDPNGEGIDDLSLRRLRFIGDPNARIAEDYLRILRFFRFHAWYADPAGGIDAEALAACAAGKEGIESLSRERVGAEILKLLSASDPAPALASMEQAGILATALPGAEAAFVTQMTALDVDMDPNPIRRLAALGGQNVADALRLSKAQSNELALLTQEMGRMTRPGELGYRYGAKAAWDILLLRALATGAPPTLPDRTAANDGAQAEFPVRAADLMPTFVGPALGKRLDALESVWIASDFKLTREELLSSA